jgi:hypothetical protein
MGLKGRKGERVRQGGERSYFWNPEISVRELSRVGWRSGTAKGGVERRAGVR